MAVIEAELQYLAVLLTNDVPNFLEKADYVDFARFTKRTAEFLLVRFVVMVTT